MKLALKTCTLDMPYTDMLDFCVEQGVSAVEIGTGNWSGAPHIDLEEMVSSETARQRWMDEMRRRNIELCALNCSGNPLAYEKDWAVTEKTFRLAEKLGVKKIVMMSGLPAGCPGDRTPVWVTTSWPPETQDILDYQWNEVAIPKWKELVHMAADCGIERIALENHAMQLVYNPETLLRLREAVGPEIGANFDPSHLIWQGMDPCACIRELGKAGAIFHFHAKDTKIDPINCALNGVLDTDHYGKEMDRSWIFRTVGYGHGAEYWKAIISELRLVGYDYAISIEHEDSLMSGKEGLLKAVEFLKDVLIFEERGEMFWA